MKADLPTPLCCGEPMAIDKIWDAGAQRFVLAAFCARCLKTIPVYENRPVYNPPRFEASK